MSYSSAAAALPPPPPEVTWVTKGAAAQRGTASAAKQASSKGQRCFGVLITLVAVLVPMLGYHFYSKSARGVELQTPPPAALQLAPAMPLSPPANNNNGGAGSPNGPKSPVYHRRRRRPRAAAPPPTTTTPGFVLTNAPPTDAPTAAVDSTAPVATAATPTESPTPTEAPTEAPPLPPPEGQGAIEGVGTRRRIGAGRFHSALEQRRAAQRNLHHQGVLARAAPLDASAPVASAPTEEAVVLGTEAAPSPAPPVEVPDAQRIIYRVRQAATTATPPPSAAPSQKASSPSPPPPAVSSCSGGAVNATMDNVVTATNGTAPSSTADRNAAAPFSTIAQYLQDEDLVVNGEDLERYPYGEPRPQLAPLDCATARLHVSLHYIVGSKDVFGIPRVIKTAATIAAARHTVDITMHFEAMPDDDDDAGEIPWTRSIGVVAKSFDLPLFFQRHKALTTASIMTQVRRQSEAEVAFVSTTRYPIDASHVRYWCAHGQDADNVNATVALVPLRRRPVATAPPRGRNGVAEEWVVEDAEILTAMRSPSRAFTAIGNGTRVDFRPALVVKNSCGFTPRTGRGLPLVTVPRWLQDPNYTCTRTVIPLTEQGLLEVDAGVRHRGRDADGTGWYAAEEGSFRSMRTTLPVTDTCNRTHGRMSYHMSTFRLANRLVNVTGHSINVASGIPMNVDFFLHSNEPISREDLNLTSSHIRYTNLVYPALEHNFYLTWVPRWLMHKQQKAGIYDAYTYIEDDMELRPQSVSDYWCVYKDPMKSSGHMVAFVRWEWLDGEKRVTDAGGPDWLHMRRHEINGAVFNEKTGNRYSGLWIVDRVEMDRFVNFHQYYRGLNKDGVHTMLREEASWFHAPQRLLHGQSLILLDRVPNGGFLVDDKVFVWHIPGMQGGRSMDEIRGFHMAPLEEWKGKFRTPDPPPQFHQFPQHQSSRRWR